MSELKDLSVAVASEVAAQEAVESTASSVFNSVKDNAIELVSEYPVVAAVAAAIGVVSVSWWGIKKLRKK